MVRKDWWCPRCGKLMVSSQCDRFMVCMHCWAPMKMRRGMKDLMAARRVDYRRFTISSYCGFWEYVPHAHKSCMDRAPEPDTIIAKVDMGNSVTGLCTRPMTFRQAKPPRAKK